MDSWIPEVREKTIPSPTATQLQNEKLRASSERIVDWKYFVLPHLFFREAAVLVLVSSLSASQFTTEYGSFVNFGLHDPFGSETMAAVKSGHTYESCCVKSGNLNFGIYRNWR